jgi:hypothetical protein
MYQESTIKVAGEHAQALETAESESLIIFLSNDISNIIQTETIKFLGRAASDEWITLILSGTPSI